MTVEMEFMVDVNKRKRQALQEADEKLAREDELNDSRNPSDIKLTSKQAMTMHNALRDEEDGDYARLFLRKKKSVKPKPKRKVKKVVKKCRCKK